MKKAILAGVAILCAAAIGYFVVQDRSSTVGLSEHGLFFPQLIDRIEEVSEITIVTNQNEFKIIYGDDGWNIDVLDSYPARFSAVQNLLIGLSQLRKLEPKTSDPAKHSVLGLAGVDTTDSPTVQVIASTEEGDQIANIYLGKKQVSKKNPQLDEYYVRAPGQNQTWLSESVLDIAPQPIGWLDSEIIDLDVGRVKEVLILSGGSVTVRVQKLSVTDKNFSLSDIPDQHKIRHQYAINDIGEIFRVLQFNDVRKSTGWTESATTVKVKTYDGLTVNAELGRDTFAEFAIMSAETDESVTQEILDEKRNLNNKWSGWAYKLSDTRLKTINTSLEDLVELASDG